MELIISSVIGLLATVVSGMAMFFLKRYFTKREERDKAREARMAEENILILRSIHAVGKLTIANSIALRDGKTNGEMTNALSEYEHIERELYNFLLTANFQNLQ